MPDVFNPEERSRIMAKVRGENTSPERLVRSLIHKMGYRFRLNVKDLPGKPDIVLKKHKKVIFVHGCFWHQHEGCPHAARPSSNTEYWNKKLDRNMIRDRENVHKLEYLGWNVLIVWECETRDREKLFDKLKGFLTS
ncbi:MAG: DNA mismatch endonuclease Vsr [Roseiflexus sp.]|jgi:DNA mismatch endonuclease (patch repair protein)|nr:DNA mismatch endonuclease Vsr [Roseiflexus sp.]MBO9334781.1 DNA mismatch endonuclease Vsr [Roseiflexus sp.]MBO9364052.1 DNA mismatch endonuclease Vsr [Roseiflexus sp.]MBO9384373.1 DNA mismatch endonuclease Vsr [Roseiflexus sp.]MBO9388549.1 DNA mismatch endonuclease Vsr [Roseiflexus sp.]